MRDHSESLKRLLSDGLPLNVDAERSMLGAMLLANDGTAVDEAVGIVPDADMLSPGWHRSVYHALVSTREKAKPVDLTTISSTLTAFGEDKAADRLLELAESVPSAAAVSHYARLVRDNHRRRLLLDSLAAGIGEAYASADAPATAWAAVLDRLLSLGMTDEKAEVVELPALVRDAYERIERMAESGEASGIPTGVVDLDRMLSGLEPGSLTTLGARSSVGKTAMGLQWFERMARDGYKPVMFSLEMSKEQLGVRLLGGESGLPVFDLRGGTRLSRDQWGELASALGRLQSLDCRFAMTPGISAAGVRSLAAPLARAGKCGVVFVDHLHLMRHPKANNEVDAIKGTTWALKTLAMDLRVPVVLLAQLNRGSDRDNRAPKLIDLRGSGAIEEDSDNVVLLHRPDKGDPEAVHIGATEQAKAIVAKNRQGPCGSIDLRFVQKTMRFEGIARYAA